MSLPHQLTAYFKYYWRAKTVYSAHSPFIYEFINSVLDTKKNYYAYQTIHTIRSLNEADLRDIQITDLGAGSHVNNAQVKTVKTIAKSAASSQWQGKILFNLMQYFKPKSVLELGTSLGISTLYLALGNMNSNVVTIEGDPKVAEISKENFSQAKVNNVQLRVGNFDDLLPELLQEYTPDLSFIDGNHTEAATLNYFNQIANVPSSNSIVILDDIHWSKGMQRAWEKAKENPKYNLSIDLFYFGILFQSDKLFDKKHITLIDSKFKPFSKGVFGIL